MVGTFRDEAATEAFMDAAQRLEVAGQIDYRGVIPRESLPDVYRQADCLLAPSIWEEPFGLMSVEAQACGTPVVASRVGGLPETILDGRTGFLCDPGDAETMADQIQQLHCDAVLWGNMSTAASVFAATHFRIDAKVEQIDDMITAISRTT
jgi:D-inositol-3-phosphate glycosyltransferase